MHTEKNYSKCPGCKVELPIRNDLFGNQGGLGRYGVTSPECAALSNEVYSKFFDPLVSMDAYAVQHPPNAELQAHLKIEKRLIDASIQSIGIHLVILYLKLEKQTPPKKLSLIVSKILAEKQLPHLLPPSNLGSIKITDIARATTHHEFSTLVLAWSHVAWNAWSDHHQTIRQWSQKFNP